MFSLPLLLLLALSCRVWAAMGVGKARPSPRQQEKPPGSPGPDEQQLRCIITLPALGHREWASAGPGTAPAAARSHQPSPWGWHWPPWEALQPAGRTRLLLIKYLSFFFFFIEQIGRGKKVWLNLLFYLLRHSRGTLVSYHSSYNCFHPHCMCLDMSSSW